MKERPRPPAPTTIVEILRSPVGSRHLGDEYPGWHQGRSERLSKTIQDAEREADLLANALRRDGSEEALNLADVLDECTPRRPCTSGACPICQTAAQRVFVDATRNAFRNSDTAWITINAVYVGAAMEDDALDEDLFNPLRQHSTSNCMTLAQARLARQGTRRAPSGL
jgi:hypothetical protein